MNIDRRKLLSLHSIPVFVLIIVILAILNIRTVFEPPYLVEALNTLFVGIIPLYIAYVAARTFKISGSMSILLMGSGMLVIGLGLTASGWILVVPGAQNASVTLANSCYLVGSIFAFSAALLYLSWPVSSKGGRTITSVVTIYGGVIAFTLLIMLTALLGITPTFFIRGVGPTLLRAVVLAGAFGFFSAASILFLYIWIRRQEDFFFWYSISVALFAICIGSITLAAAVGDVFSWTGRIAQYTAACFALAAIVTARHNAIKKGISLQDELARFFSVSDEGYKILVENAPDGIIVYRDNRFLYANNTALRLFGAETFDQLSIHTIPDLISSDDLNEGGSRIHQTRDEVVFHGQETRLIGLDGKETNVAVRTAPIEYAGRPAVIAIIRDITERKKAELALQKGVQKLDILAETARLLLASETPEHIVQNVCERVMRYLDCQIFFNYLIEDDKNRMRLNAWAGISEEKAHEIEMLDFGVAVCGCVGRDGERIIAEDIQHTPDKRTDLVRSLDISAYVCHPLIYQGKTIGTLSFGTCSRPRFTEEETELIRAVTDLVATAVARKKSEDAVRKTRDELDDRVQERTAKLNTAVKALSSERKRLYDVLETLPVYVCLLTPDYHMPFANRFFRERFGESHGRCCYDFLFGRTDPCEICDTYTVLKTRAPHHWEWTGPDKRNYDIYDFPFIDTDGSFLIMEMGIDVTERRKAEAELEKHRNHLEDLISQRTVELESANTQLREEISKYNQAKEELLVKNEDLNAAYEKITASQEELQQINDELIKSEEELRNTSQYLENLINYANAPIVVWDPNFVITRFNRAFEELTGRTAREIIGQRLEVLFPQRYLDASMEIIRKTMHGERLKIVEIPILNRKGEIRIVLWNSATLFESDGKTIQSTIAQGNDITERKLAEAELAKRNEELNSAIDELTRRGDELAEALKEREILLSEIHHRVKNNLTAFISLLSLKGSYDETPAGNALKKDLQNRARSMALIHETLYRTGKYSQVDMGEYLSPLIHQIALSYDPSSMIRTEVKADGATLDLNRATPCGLIVTEIITNSFKYAFPESFNCMKMRSEPCTIRVSLKRDGEDYCLSVSDNGIGLPPGFDIRTAQSLGLRLVYFLARHQLKARIEVRTGVGTEIIFRFSDTHSIKGIS